MDMDMQTLRSLRAAMDAAINEAKWTEQPHLHSGRVFHGTCPRGLFLVLISWGKSEPRAHGTAWLGSCTCVMTREQSERALALATGSV